MSTEVLDACLILGNPNSGKSLLFNRLTGLSQKVANFPGVTVEVREGRGGDLLFRDFPGIYSLEALTKDELVAIERLREALAEPTTRALVYVADATRLERSLYLLLQLIEETQAHDCPLIVALNIVDEVFAKGAKINPEGLSAALGVPVIAISAKTKLGLLELSELVARTVRRTTTLPKPRPVAVDATAKSSARVVPLRRRAKELALEYGPHGEMLLIGQNKLDGFFLSSFWGIVIFLGIMLLLFQSIFSWAAPVMDLISNAVSSSGEFVSSHLTNPILSDFVKNAVFEGIGSFLVFAPQIFILFVVIGILEDSGYLARASIMFHRPLSWFGLTGRSFVPLLSGHACAIPAIMATRTIESPRRRLATILAIPFMACSARIPVYAVLIAGFVPTTPLFAGFVTLQGVSFFGLYALGLITGLLATGFVSMLALRGHSKHQDAPFVVELPPYRWPSMKPIAKVATYRTLDFVKKAGGIIFAVTVVIWALGYFPHGAGHLDTSFLGRMGHAIEGVFRPMGMDWRIGVAVLTSFLAREVFVGTLGTLYGLQDAGDNIQTLSDTMKSGGMTLASAGALLVFYALSMQCVSTLAVMKKETNSTKVPVLVFIGMTVLAYAASVVTYKLLAQ